MAGSVSASPGAQVSFNFGGPSSPFKPKYFRPTAQPAPVAPPVQPGLPTLKPQEIYLQNKVNAAPSLANQAAAAAGAGRAASTASTAASTAGQTQQQAQGATMATAANTAQPSGYMLNGVSYATESDRNQAAAAAGAGRAAQAGSTAATQAGQQQQQAQGNTMATAASSAAAPAAVQPAPAQDFSLTKQPWITESGRLYERGVEDRLKGVDPLVKNAQNTADTQASRNNYYARTNAQEGAAQARFAPGTIQYQRMTDESQAGANRANLTGQNNVNQFTRERSAEANAMGLGIEKDAYGNAIGERNFRVGEADKKYQRGYQEGRDAISDQRWNTTNTQDQTQQAWSNAQQEKILADAQEAVRKGDARAAIAAIGSTTGKNYLYSILASQGPDAVLAAIPGMFEGGKILEKFADQNAVRQDAENWISMTTDLRPGTPEFEKAVADRMILVDGGAQGPLIEAKETSEQKAIEEKIRAGQPLTDAEQASAISKGTIPEFTTSNLGGYKDKKVADLVGKPINIGGKIYTVVQGGRTRTGSDTFTTQERHTDWTQIKDQSGQSWYVYGGRLNAAPPRQTSNDVTPFGF